MNPRIAAAQAALNRLTGAGLTVDGQYGPKMRRAVAAFQASRRLKADGLLGPKTYAALGVGATPSIPIPPPSRPAAGPVPPESTESDPPQTTLYFRMPTGGEGGSKPLTAVYFPANFQPSDTIDCIVWFQGHHRGEPNLSIDRYLSGKWISYFKFREALNDTGRPFVLIAPTLGPRSQAGSLTNPGGFDAWLSRVLSSLSLSGPLQGRTPKLGNLILSCHSGGGVPMRSAALNTVKFASNLRECWGFDCMYNGNDPAEWRKWAQSNPDKKLFVYWASTTRNYSTALQNFAQPNISIQHSSTNEHNRVPITYWSERIMGFNGPASGFELTTTGGLFPAPGMVLDLPGIYT